MTSFSKWHDDLADRVRAKEQKDKPAEASKVPVGLDLARDDELLKLARMAVESTFQSFQPDSREGLTNSLADILRGYELIMSARPIAVKVGAKRLSSDFEIEIRSDRHRRFYRRLIDRVNWKFIPE